MSKQAEKADGAAGARRAAALLSVAVCAEMSHTTMDEDGAKVDLKMSLRHAFAPGSLLSAHCQVKSGNSYRSATSTAEMLTLSVNSETMRSLRQGTQPALVIWVPPRPSTRVYWHIVSLRTPEKKTQISVPRHNFVTPSLRYDISRACTHSQRAQTFQRLDVKEGDDNQVMCRAREAYKDLKSTKHEHPLVGHLHVTRFAWRHVTRTSKGKRLRTISLRVVPYLRHFLTKLPDQYFVSSVVRRMVGNHTVEERSLLFWYDDALRIKGESHSLLLRVREEVVYPRDWLEQPLSTRDVHQSATLVSWWCKKRKK